MLVIQNTHFEYSFSVESQCVVQDGQDEPFFSRRDNAKECALKKKSNLMTALAKTFSTLLIGCPGLLCACDPPWPLWAMTCARSVRVFVFIAAVTLGARNVNGKCKML